MNQANPMGSPHERLVHYLEMATKALEAARGPNTDVRVRNLYVWVSKSWEMLAIDEMDRLRIASRAKGPQRGGRIRSATKRAGEHSHPR
jgi:hypothetical protein